VNTFSNRRRER